MRPCATSRRAARWRLLVHAGHRLEQHLAELAAAGRAVTKAILEVCYLTDAEITANNLKYLEEVIMMEGGHNIAAMIIETVTGTNGVLEVYAGEKLVRFAAIQGDYGHVASKNGCGAVMGSKNLKAVGVRGAIHPPSTPFPEYHGLGLEGVTGIAFPFGRRTYFDAAARFALFAARALGACGGGPPPLTWRAALPDRACAAPSKPDRSRA